PTRPLAPYTTLFRSCRRSRGHGRELTACFGDGGTAHRAYRIIDLVDVDHALIPAVFVNDDRDGIASGDQFVERVGQGSSRFDHGPRHRPDLVERFSSASAKVISGDPACRSSFAVKYEDGTVDRFCQQLVRPFV